MSSCIRCGKEIQEECAFCPYCGHPGPSGRPTANDWITDLEWKAYVGPGSINYLKKFKKFTNTGVVRFALTWNWPAFLAGCWWMLYRKMYWWSLVAFLTWMLPHVALPAMFLWGAAGNYLYFRQAQKKIEGYKRVAGETVNPEALASLGGVHRWVWIAGLVVGLLVIGVFILIALVLYQFFSHSVVVLPEVPEIQRL